MKKNSSKTAYTLIELIVSLALVSVVVLGMFSINVVLNNNNQDYGQRYLVRSETQATLNHILNDASLAVGSATTVNGYTDQGIVLGGDPTWGWGDSNSFCIYHGSPSTTWGCYTWFPSTDIKAPYQILYCTQPYNTSSSHFGAASCPNTAQFLGTAYSISYLNGISTPPAFNSTTGFSITIQNCLNDAATGTEACAKTGTSNDMANNPEVQVAGSVFPPQESF